MLRFPVRSAAATAPAQPGAFDFQRKAYFERLGAVGYGFGPPRAVAPPTGESGGGFAAAVGRLRHAITERIAAGLDGQAGAVAAALLTGKRSTTISRSFSGG